MSDQQRYKYSLEKIVEIDGYGEALRMLNAVAKYLRDPGSGDFTDGFQTAVSMIRIRAALALDGADDPEAAKATLLRVANMDQHRELRREELYQHVFVLGLNVIKGAGGELELEVDPKVLKAMKLNQT